jgi:hypothetical protein
LRCYAVAIAFFVALAETEWEVIFRLWQVHFFLSTHFCSWISLYLVQAPVGVETENCRRTWEWVLCLNFGRNFSPVLELDQLGENPRQMIRTSRACFVAAGKQVIRWSFYCWVTWLKSIPTEVLMLIMAL